MTPRQILAEYTPQNSCKLSGKRVTHTYVSESHKTNLSEKIMSATTTATKSEKSDLSVSHTNHMSTSSSSLLSVLQGTRKEEDDIRDHRHDHLQQSQAADDKFYIHIEQGFDPGDTSSFKRDLNLTASFLSYSHRGRDSFESRTTRLEGGGEGDDAGQPTLTSCDVEHQAIFTLPRKVDSFRAYNSIGLHVNGMLFDPNALCVARRSEERRVGKECRL